MNGLCGTPSLDIIRLLHVQWLVSRITCQLFGFMTINGALQQATALSFAMGA